MSSQEQTTTTTCGFKNRAGSRTRGHTEGGHYASLYLGRVECPRFLEGSCHGVTVNVVDAQQCRLDASRRYTLDQLRFLPAALAQHHDAGVDIFFNTMHYLQYLTQITGRLGINSSQALVSLYNVPKLDNAFWTGEYAVYGNGDSMKALVATDVVSHELTHGLCQTLCGLEYKGVSGALNESFSDVLALLPLPFAARAPRL